MSRDAKVRCCGSFPVTGPPYPHKVSRSNQFSDVSVRVDTRNMS